MGIGRKFANQCHMLNMRLTLYYLVEVLLSGITVILTSPSEVWRRGHWSFLSAAFGFILPVLRDTIANDFEANGPVTEANDKQWQPEREYDKEGYISFGTPWLLKLYPAIQYHFSGNLLHAFYRGFTSYQSVFSNRPGWVKPQAEGSNNSSKGKFWEMGVKNSCATRPRQLHNMLPTRDC